jgi:3-methyladenine DNA glycosylase AlkD
VVAEVDGNLRALARTDFDAEFLQRYLGRERPALGLRNDQTRAIAKAARRQHAGLGAGDWIAVLDALYAGETYEHRVVAGMMLADNKAVRQSVAPAHFGRWLGDLQGWAEIDNTCASTWTGEEMLARWAEWQPFLQAAAGDANISLRRGSLVLLLRPVRTSADSRLSDQAFANIGALQHEREILITKAVSWLLRDLVRNHAGEVEAYLDANRSLLPAIAVRETRNKLRTGTKSGK